MKLVGMVLVLFGAVVGCSGSDTRAVPELDAGARGDAAPWIDPPHADAGYADSPVFADGGFSCDAPPLAVSYPVGGRCFPDGPSSLCGGAPAMSYSCAEGPAGAEGEKTRPAGAGACFETGWHEDFGTRWLVLQCEVTVCTRYADFDAICKGEDGASPHAYACPENVAITANGCRAAGGAPNDAGVHTHWSDGASGGPTYCCP